MLVGHFLNDRSQIWLSDDEFFIGILLFTLIIHVLIRSYLPYLDFTIFSTYRPDVFENGLHLDFLLIHIPDIFNINQIIII